MKLSHDTKLSILAIGSIVSVVGMTSACRHQDEGNSTSPWDEPDAPPATLLALMQQCKISSERLAWDIDIHRGPEWVLELDQKEAQDQDLSKCLDGWSKADPSEPGFWINTPVPLSPDTEEAAT